MDRYFDSERKSNFSRRISSLIDEMKAFKSAHPDLWKLYYNDLIGDLETILETIDDNIIEANKLFQALPISVFDSFQLYVFNTDVNSISTIKGTNE